MQTFRSSFEASQSNPNRNRNGNRDQIEWEQLSLSLIHRRGRARFARRKGTIAPARRWESPHRRCCRCCCGCCCCCCRFLGVAATRAAIALRTPRNGSLNHHSVAESLVAARIAIKRHQEADGNQSFNFLNISFFYYSSIFFFLVEEDVNISFFFSLLKRN